MKTDNEHIARMARQLRDEENSQLHVRPWNRHRFRIPSWLMAIPAAAIIGFFFGLWTSNKSATIEPLTALVDTVYITKEVPAKTDTSITITPTAEQPSVRTVTVSRPARHTRTVPTGQPIESDRIRYDLLVKN